jgi:hypothetical protein
MGASMDIATSHLLTKFLLAAWSLLSAAEWFANLALFRADGLLSWQVLKLRPRLSRSQGLHTVLYSSRAFLAVIGGRAFAGLGLLVPGAIGLDFACACFIVGSCLYVSRRAVFGSDGSDQMGMVVAAGVAITSAGIALDDRALAYCGVLAIAAQATLAYFIAGAAKLASPVWREGHAVPRVMSTRSYGHPVAARIAASHPRFSLGLCWFIIVTEMLFPLVFLLPAPIAILTLGCYVFFHLCNAYFMGLNAFVWPFLATYPSVMLMNETVRSSVGWQ